MDFSWNEVVADVFLTHALICMLCNHDPSLVLEVKK